MKRAVAGAKPLGIRAAMPLAEDLHREWKLPIDRDDDFDPVLYRVRKETRQVQQEYTQQLAVQKKGGNLGALRNVPDGFTLFFTPLVPIDGNEKHVQWKMQIHKSEVSDTYWPNCQFLFDAVFQEPYPAEAPKVTCKTTLYHPNIDGSSGEVCLSSLKNGWKPATTIYDIIQAIFATLFQDPNANDPLPNCKEAASLLLSDKEEFRKRAKAHAERHKTFIPGSDEHRRY